MGKKEGVGQAPSPRGGNPTRRCGFFISSVSFGFRRGQWIVEERERVVRESRTNLEAI